MSIPVDGRKKGRKQLGQRCLRPVGPPITLAHRTDSLRIGSILVRLNAGHAQGTNSAGLADEKSRHDGSNSIQRFASAPIEGQLCHHRSHRGWVDPHELGTIAGAHLLSDGTPLRMNSTLMTTDTHPTLVDADFGWSPTPKHNLTLCRARAPRFKDWPKFRSKLQARVEWGSVTGA